MFVTKKCAVTKGVGLQLTFIFNIDSSVDYFLDSLMYHL